MYHKSVVINKCRRQLCWLCRDSNVAENKTVISRNLSWLIFCTSCNVCAALFLLNLGLSLNLSHALPNFKTYGFSHRRGNCVSDLAILIKDASVENEGIRKPLRSKNDSKISITNISWRHQLTPYFKTNRYLLNLFKVVSLFICFCSNLTCNPVLTCKILVRHV